ncbi:MULTISPECIES: T9SS type B sorting domain-containing protein [Winogradskyella]|uniref:T9SS type B sorting domain-containing protein n=1 Tax=Winogradskyella TaxID=286104 RepID=UPI0015CCA4C0|nr:MULTISPECIES: T9SS type B sorting domain-containing protein [Winogradskyella]QXP79359.1 T9SS type B sorting domain-containing protein [Winogradskyella sp. HaHa_3_26]
MKKPTFSKIALIILVLILGQQAYAQNYEPFMPRFNDDLKGDIILIGNNILGPDNNAFNSNWQFNHQVNMSYIDIDGDSSTFSSSSADLDIDNPNCYKIIYAGLYWGAVNPGDEPITDVKLKGPIGGYNDIEGTVIYEAGTNTVDGGDSFSYACFADVTSIVTSFGSGVDLGTYTVANVSSAEGRTAAYTPYNGTGQSAGWSLFVVYEDPTLPGKSITSFDGFSAISVAGGNSNLDIPVDGFRTVPAPAPVRANFAFATLEGDSPISGDRLKLNGVSLSTTDRSADNFFNSSVTQLDATPVNDRVPNSTNTLGFDTGVIAIPNPGNSVIANDATSGTIRLETSGDTYFPYFFAFAVEIIEPHIVLTKIVEDDAGNDIGDDYVGLGTSLNYVIGFQNTGNDNATNFQVRDILPVNIIFNYPDDLVLPTGVSVVSYDPDTREIIFAIDDSIVEENDPVYEIRIEVQVVESCNLLVDACSNIISNQAFASYNGFYNPNFHITDDPSLSANVGCLISPQATNFLADLNCTFSEEIILCGDSVELTAADGYDSYAWSTSSTGTPVIGNTQTITVTETETYYSFNTAVAPCQSIIQEFDVQLFGGNTTNPVTPYADEVVICPNDGKELPNIFLCGDNDSRLIETNISSSISVIWEKLDETSCSAVTDSDCANEDTSCTWNEVSNGSNYLADTAGQYRLTINYPGGCFNQFYFNVYENILNATINAIDIICDTPGSITVNGVPSGYEYSLDGITYQNSNVFEVTTPGFYTAYIRQINITTNPCVFTVPDVQIRDRDFSGSAIITQPFCHGDKGSIHLAANDSDPQYTFTLSQGGTQINSVGPIVENNYTFQNLNPGTYTATITSENGCSYSEDITIVDPPLLTATVALTSPLNCTEGEITVYPVGGTAPYFYFVNGSTDFQTFPEIGVTTGGTYNITVTDSNNCTTDVSITVEAIEGPEFTISTIDITCVDSSNAGILTINVSNSNGNSIMYSIDGGLTYVSSNVFYGLTAGDYDVQLQYTLGSEICETDPQTTTINSASTIVGTVELTTPLTCTSEGVITVTNATGGVAPYYYSIDGINFQPSTVFDNLTQGNYTILILDSTGCSTATEEITIEALNPPTDLEFDNISVTCPTNTTTVTITNTTGGTGTLEYQITAPASAATSYQTSTSFPGLEPGTYTFQVKDENDCTYSESYTVDPITAPTVAIVLAESLDCSATPDAIITGTITGLSPYTYSVSIDGAAYTSIGATGTPFNYTTVNAGTYQFEITDANGCTAESNIVTVNPLSLPAFDVVAQVQPILCNGDTNGSINVEIDTDTGTPPFQTNVYNDTTGTDYGTQTSSLPAGTYTITVTDAKLCTDTETVVIDQPDPINVTYEAVDITCTSTGVSQGSVIIDGVTGGIPPYNYFVTGTNGYSNSELNNLGTTSVNFDVVDFGLYQINVVDANGCSVLIQDVLVASPPTDLDIDVIATVDCTTGGEVVVSIGSTLASAGPFFFSIYEGPGFDYPTGTWLAEDTAGSQSATFTGLIPGVLYTFIVYDQATNCSYYEPSIVPIPTNSTLTATAVSANNITCTGSADGTASFTVNSVYSSTVNVDYEIFDSLSLNTTGITGSGTIAANGSLNVTDLGPLPYGNYFVSIRETSGPNAGCGIVTVPFNITESAFLLELEVSIDQDANCAPNSGVISAIGSNGTPPYQYQITTSATAPPVSDTNWASTSIFNMDAGSYYVHVTDAYGCVVTSDVDLTMVSSPEISANVTNQCTAIEGEYEIGVSLIDLGVPPYSVSINGGAFQSQSFPFIITNLNSGTHTVTINDFNGCGNTVSLDITPPITLTPEVTVLPTCNDDDGEITMTGTGGSGLYTYSIAPSFASIAVNGNIFTGVPSGTYTITITDTVTGCTEEVSVAVAAAVLPTFTLTPTSVTCFGDNSGSFELNVANYSGAYTYEVFDTAGASVTGVVNANTSTNPEIVSGMEAGTFTVVITETDIPFCSATNNVTITSPLNALSLNISETSNVTCTDSEGTISAIATGGWGDYEYELTGAATVAYSSNGSFTGLSAGSYTVNVKDAGGCITSESITLEIPDPITATFTPNTTLLSCFADQDASITITNVIGGQGSNYTYTLNTVLPTPSASGPQTSNVFENLGQGTYFITITDGYDCEVTSLDIVISEPAPIEASLVRATTQTCLTESTLTLSATGGTGLYSYSENDTFSPIIGTFTTSTTFSVPDGTYSYFVRDANGCVTNVSNEITVDPLLPLEVTLEASNLIINCSGDNNGSILANATGGLGNYVYILQDNLGNVVAAPQTSPGFFTELFAGDYVVLVESGDCATTSTPISITEPDNPVSATLNINNVSCAGSNNGSIEVIATGGTGIIKYAISPQLNQFFDINTFENLAPDDYTIIVQDELGCYLTLDVTITEPQPVILSIVPNSLIPEVCTGELEGEFSIAISGGTLPYSVSLDSYDGPYTTGNATQTEFYFNNLAGGDHIVFVKDAEECESEWNITFPESVSILPEVVIENICDNNTQGNIVTVTVDASIEDLTLLEYSLNGGPYQPDNVFTNLPEGTGYYIEVMHENLCVQRTELFDIDTVAPVTLTLAEGGLNEFIATAAGGRGDYQYTLNGEDVGSENTYIITESGLYTVTVTDSSGCFATAQIELEFQDICITNWFTPNGDGNYDTWAPGCTENYPDLTFDIFDRYGRKIATYRVGESWDGRYDGKELPSGDYWFVVQTNDETNDKEFVGHFTLYR